MIQYTLTQTVRIACDHCGRPYPDEVGAGAWYVHIEDARRAAEDEGGYHYTRWKDGECARELCLCPPCYEKVCFTAPASAQRDQ